MASRHVYFLSLNFLAKLMQRPKVTCLLEVCFRNSSLDMILSGVAWDKHVWPRNSSAFFTASEASAASWVCLSKSSLKAAVGSSFMEWYFFHPLLGSQVPALLAPRSRKVPTDGANVKVRSLTIVQRTSNGGQDTRFGTRRCAFDDEPYGVAESYSREGVDIVVNSPRNPEIGLWGSWSNRMG
ncbi:hypothetical protein PIB30_070200 [Stylosanthes scabra]|uniref:Uncharacterized protein n=1 Tax=Stylosanthes scabra TaxID=79078 RepID=A0ABU6VMW1_9FABA|nr:hypothetical protein [Stylosanthes scabra]